MRLENYKLFILLTMLLGTCIIPLAAFFPHNYHDPYNLVMMTSFATFLGAFFAIPIGIVTYFLGKPILTFTYAILNAPVPFAAVELAGTMVSLVPMLILYGIAQSKNTVIGIVLAQFDHVFYFGLACGALAANRVLRASPTDRDVDR